MFSGEFSDFVSKTSEILQFKICLFIYLFKIKKNPSKEPDNIDTPNNGTDDESSEEECAINDEEISALEYESDSEEFDSSTVCKRI